MKGCDIKKKNLSCMFIDPFSSLKPTFGSSIQTNSVELDFMFLSIVSAFIDKNADKFSVEANKFEDLFDQSRLSFKIDSISESIKMLKQIVDQRSFEVSNTVQCFIQQQVSDVFYFGSPSKRVLLDNQRLYSGRLLELIQELYDRGKQLLESPGKFRLLPYDVEQIDWLSVDGDLVVSGGLTYQIIPEIEDFSVPFTFGQHDVFLGQIQGTWTQSGGQSVLLIVDSKLLQFRFQPRGLHFLGASSRQLQQICYFPDVAEETDDILLDEEAIVQKFCQKLEPTNPKFAAKNPIGYSRCLDNEVFLFEQEVLLVRKQVVVSKVSYRCVSTQLVVHNLNAPFCCLVQDGNSLVLVDFVQKSTVVLDNKEQVSSLLIVDKYLAFTTISASSKLRQAQYFNVVDLQLKSSVLKIDLLFPQKVENLILLYQGKNVFQFVIQVQNSCIFYLAEVKILSEASEAVFNMQTKRVMFPIQKVIINSGLAIFICYYLNQQYEQKLLIFDSQLEQHFSTVCLHNSQEFRFLQVFRGYLFVAGSKYLEVIEFGQAFCSKIKVVRVDIVAMQLFNDEQGLSKLAFVTKQGNVFEIVHSLSGVKK